MLEISDAGFGKPVPQWMDADPPIRAALRQLSLDTNGGSTMQEMRDKFHGSVSKLGSLPAPGTPEETQGEYGKLTAAYTLLIGRALGVGKPPPQPRPPKPADGLAPGPSWVQLQAALEGVGWRTDRCPLLCDGSGHGRRFLGSIYHGGLPFASASATPSLPFLVRAGAAPDRAGIPSSQAEAIQRAFLLQLADAICRGVPLVIDLRPCPGVDPDDETASTLLLKWRTMLETVRKRVLVAVRAHGHATMYEPEPEPEPEMTAWHKQGGVRDMLSGMAQSGDAGDDKFLQSVLRRKPNKPDAKPESPYVCFSTIERPKVERQGLQVAGGPPSAAAIAEELKLRWDNLPAHKKGAFHDEAASNKANNFSAQRVYDAKRKAWLSELAEAGGLGRGTRVTLHGLKAAPQHNGKQGTIMNWLSAKGRYNVQVVSDGNGGVGSRDHNNGESSVQSPVGVGRLLGLAKGNTYAKAAGGTSAKGLTGAGLAVRPVNILVDSLVVAKAVSPGGSTRSENSDRRHLGSGTGGESIINPSPMVSKDWIKAHLKPWLLKEDGLYLALLEKRIATQGGERPILLAAGLHKEALQGGTRNMIASAAAAAASGAKAGALVEAQRSKFFLVFLADTAGCPELLHHCSAIRTAPLSSGRLLERGSSGDRFRVEAPELEQALGISMAGIGALVSDQV